MPDMRRVGFVYPMSNLDTVPSVCAAIELLADAGYRVDVFTRPGPGFITPVFESSRVEVLVDLPRHRRVGIHRLLPGRWSSPLRVWQRHRACPYHCVIAIEPRGLRWSRALFRRLAVPVAYLSLELLLVDETSSAKEQALKQLEVEMARRAPFVIVQDAARAELLCAATGIGPEQIVLLPNAPQGPGRRRASDYWHRRFELAESRRVALHAGSLYPWTRIEDIVASVRSWPEDWVLVVHTRFQAGDSETVDELRRLAADCPGRVFFSLEPVSRQDYEELIDGAHLGIAFYDPAVDSEEADENLRTIGLSSGKIAHYLGSGLPVIVNNASSVGEWVAAERCGASVASSDQIAAALTEIDRDPEGYSARAVQVFDRDLDFARAFDEVIRRLQELENTPVDRG